MDPRPAGCAPATSDGGEPGTAPLELVREGEASTVRLSAEQRELLREACIRYRRSLPIYLQSAQQQMEELDSLIAKLR